MWWVSCFFPLRVWLISCLFYFLFIFYLVYFQHSARSPCQYVRRWRTVRPAECQQHARYISIVFGDICVSVVVNVHVLCYGLTGVCGGCGAASCLIYRNLVVVLFCPPSSCFLLLFFNIWTFSALLALFFFIYMNTFFSYYFVHWSFITSSFIYSHLFCPCHCNYRCMCVFVLLLSLSQGCPLALTLAPISPPRAMHPWRRARWVPLVLQVCTYINKYMHARVCFSLFDFHFHFD